MTFLQRITAKRQDDLERFAGQRGLVLVEPSGFNQGDIIYWSMARPVVTDEMVAAAWLAAFAGDNPPLDEDEAAEQVVAVIDKADLWVMLEAALST